MPLQMWTPFRLEMWNCIWSLPALSIRSKNSCIPREPVAWQSPSIVPYMLSLPVNYFRRCRWCWAMASISLPTYCCWVRRDETKEENEKKKEKKPHQHKYQYQHTRRYVSSLSSSTYSCINSNRSCKTLHKQLKWMSCKLFASASMCVCVWMRDMSKSMERGRWRRSRRNYIESRHMWIQILQWDQYRYMKRNNSNDLTHNNSSIDDEHSVQIGHLPREQFNVEENVFATVNHIQIVGSQHDFPYRIRICAHYDNWKWENGNWFNEQNV